MLVLFLTLRVIYLIYLLKYYEGPKNTYDLLNYNNSDFFVVYNFEFILLTEMLFFLSLYVYFLDFGDLTFQAILSISMLGIIFTIIGDLLVSDTYKWSRTYQIFFILLIFISFFYLFYTQHTSSKSGSS